MSTLPSQDHLPAHLSACHTGTKGILADGDLFIHNIVCKVVDAMRHCADKDGDRVILGHSRQILRQPLHGCVVRKRDLVRIAREVIRDGVFDHLEQLFGSLHASDAELVQQLHHQAREALECARNANMWVHLDQHAFGSVNVDL